MNSSAPPLFFLCIGVLLILSFFESGKKLLFPVQFFTTWIHEVCHAVVAALLGAKSISIEISSDGSGTTHFKLKPNRVKEALIASAGYVGTSAVGAGLIGLVLDIQSKGTHESIRQLILMICALLGLTLVLWVRNFFGMLSVLFFGTLFYLLSESTQFRQHRAMIILFLSIQTSLNALFDIRLLLSLKPKSRSDAHTLERLFLLPARFWAMSWLLLSVSLFYFTLKLRHVF